MTFFLAASGDLRGSVAGIGGDAHGEVGAGLGVEGEARAGFHDGKLNFDVGAGAFLGVGGDVDFSGTVDFGQMERAARDGERDVERAGRGLEHAAGDVERTVRGWFP